MGENLSTREVIEELSRQENKAKKNSGEATEERKEKLKDCSAIWDFEEEPDFLGFISCLILVLS